MEPHSEPELPGSRSRFDPGNGDESLELPPALGSAGPAVEQLLEELETEADPAGMVGVGGMRGRVAIVTGGSTGIGRAVGLSFARSGVHVAFNYLDENEDSRIEAERTAADLEELGVKVFHRPVDCSDSEAVTAFVSETIDRLGGLHMLINNAGVSLPGELSSMSDEEWETVLRTNLSGAFYFLRAAASPFKRQEYGKVVNVASVHGLRSEPGLVNLSASKAGVLALTRGGARELGPWNVNVNAVAPGYTRTSRLTKDVPAEVLDRVRSESALRRLGDPQDVAGAVLFLCSEAARHITGAVLPVDGGYLL